MQLQCFIVAGSALQIYYISLCYYLSSLLLLQCTKSENVDEQHNFGRDGTKCKMPILLFIHQQSCQQPTECHDIVLLFSYWFYCPLAPNVALWQAVFECGLLSHHDIDLSTSRDLDLRSRVTQTLPCTSVIMLIHNMYRVGVEVQSLLDILTNSHTNIQFYVISTDFDELFVTVMC